MWADEQWCWPGAVPPIGALAKMSAEILTEAKVLRFVRIGLPTDKPSATLWAAAPKGLGLRLRQGGAASWIYVYRPKGAGRSAVSRTVTIGRQDLLSLKQAEAAATRAGGRGGDEEGPSDRAPGRASARKE